MTKPRWTLRHLLLATTLVALYLGLLKYLNVGIEDTIMLAVVLVMLLAIIFEHKMPQSVSLIIVAITLSLLFYLLLVPTVH